MYRKAALLNEYYSNLFATGLSAEPLLLCIVFVCWIRFFIWFWFRVFHFLFGSPVQKKLKINILINLQCQLFERAETIPSKGKEGRKKTPQGLLNLPAHLTSLNWLCLDQGGTTRFSMKRLQYFLLYTDFFFVSVFCLFENTISVN